MSSNSGTTNRSKLIASAAICASLYAIVNALTSFISTPFGLGEFRPGAVIPAFFAITVGPLPAALGAGIGSFLGDMISLVPTGRSTFLWALVAGGTGNFLGFLTLGYVYDKLKNWRGFIVGSTAGLFVGNVVAAAGVVLLGMFFLPPSSLNTFNGMPGGPAAEIGMGLFLFWFGTMFPFVIILVPPIVRLLRPYAGSLSVGRRYPDLRETNKRLLWSWSIIVALLVLAALAVAIFSGIPGIDIIVKAYGGVRTWEGLFIVAAAAVLIAGAFLPQLSSPPKSEEKVSAN